MLWPIDIWSMEWNGKLDCEWEGTKATRKVLCMKCTMQGNRANEIVKKKKKICVNDMS